MAERHGETKKGQLHAPDAADLLQFAGSQCATGFSVLGTPPAVLLAALLEIAARRCLRQPG